MANTSTHILSQLIENIKSELKVEMFQELEMWKKELLCKKKPFLTIDEAAKYLSLSTNTLYQYVSRNKISYYKPSRGKIYFSVYDLDSFVLNSRIHYKSKEDIEREVNNALILEDVIQ